MDSTKDTCGVCAEEELVEIRIGGDAVCKGCVKSYIVPMFTKARKHEADYPPTWGNIRLNAEDFKEHFMYPGRFMHWWRKKEVEYGTPISKRLYCGRCQHFNGEKDLRRLITVKCERCQAGICDACGETEFDDHECKKEENPFEGMTRGKDYQLCPNADCGMHVELKDGCNAMSCSRCLVQFCYICGEAASGRSGHWNAGSKNRCPRWNQPDAPNAMFDRPTRNPPQPVELLTRVTPRRPTAADIIAQMREFRLRSDQDFNRIANMIRHLEELPPLPQAPNTNLLQPITNLQLEQNMATELLASPRGILMQHQQSQVDAMLQVATGMTMDSEDNGLEIPRFLSRASDTLIKLRMNLNVYVWRHRVEADRRGYRRRHVELLQFAMGEHRRAVHEHFPLLLTILTFYVPIAGVRLQFEETTNGMVEFLGTIGRRA